MGDTIAEEPVIERAASNTVEEQDEGRLAAFGYKQELRRDWGLLHNFGVSFSIIVRDALFSFRFATPSFAR